MAEVRVVQGHQLTVDEAKNKLESFEAMLTKYGVSLQWSGSSAKVKGFGVSGNIAVTTSDITVVLKLGMMARAAGVDAERLKGSITRRLTEAYEA